MTFHDFARRQLAAIAKAFRIPQHMLGGAAVRPPPTMHSRGRGWDTNAVPPEKRFCTSCGLNYGEWLTCEDGPCVLETSDQARERLALAQARQQPGGHGTSEG